MSEKWGERVVLDLHPGEPIRGRISSGGRAESFHGWIDLASKLEHLRSDTGPPMAGPTESTGEHDAPFPPES